MLAVVAPGQGSQSPGFLTPWMELEHFEERMRWLSIVADIDLIAHGTTSDEATIRDTAIAQPLIVAASLVSLLNVFQHPSEVYDKVAIGAGHSVGEITAACATNVITAEQAMVFVRERGRAMSTAAQLSDTGMVAVLGGEKDAVLDAIQKHGLTPANVNGGGQIVAAGTRADLQIFADNAKQIGVKCVPLSVAGAFHSKHMDPAAETLGYYAHAISTKDPRIELLSNVDGKAINSGVRFLQRLVRQVNNPVRWDLCMESMERMGVTGMLELLPGGTLTGLAKRAMPSVETFAIRTPHDIPKALEFVAKHGDQAANTPAGIGHEHA